MMKQIKLTSLFLLSVVLVLQFGCATSSVFNSYTSQAKEFIAPVAVGQVTPALETLAKKTNGQDKILYLMERARIAQLGDDIQTSKSDFESAIAAIEEKRQQALISASDVGGRALSIMVNDNMIPYAGFAYEKVFVHNFQALNYLYEGDLEGAGVEVRQANFEQEWALDNHQKELAKIEEEREKKKEQYDEEKMNSEIGGAYQSMFDYAGQVKDSFQNAYTFYVSGLIWEMRNELNDAYIDYKRALEIYPDNIFVQRDVFRLGKKLKMDDAEEIAKRFPQAAKWVEEHQEKTGGELIVLFERDLVPQKQEIKIPLPLFGRIVMTSFPIYNVDRDYVGGLIVSSGETVLGETQKICDVSALAVKALQEEIPGIAMREIARVAAKAAMQKAASGNTKSILDILPSIYNIATSNADRRAWYTLPREVHIFRARLDEGPCDLSGTFAGGNVKVNADIKEGGMTLVRITKVDGAWYATSITI